MPMNLFLKDNVQENDCEITSEVESLPKMAY